MSAPAKRGQQRRVATGVYLMPSGNYRVYLPGRGKQRYTTGPGITTTEQAIAYREMLIAEAPSIFEPTTGFAADARRYLAHEKTQAMPSLRTREIEIAKWVSILKTTPTESLTTDRIDRELQKLKNEGYAGSTVNKFRTALMAMWTRLYGRGSVNPVKDTEMFDEAEMVARGQSYDLLTRILDGIPDDGPGVPIDRATLFAEVWREPITVVAARYGVSDSRLGHVCRWLDVPTPGRGHWLKRPEHRQDTPTLKPSRKSGRIPETRHNRARLEVMAWTGMDPADIKRLEPGSFSLQERWYQIPRRQKGSRRRRTMRPVFRAPMTDEALRAFERFVRVDAWGDFDTKALLKVWIRATRRAERELRNEFQDPSFSIPHIRLKDIRHSFGTMMYERTGDENATGKMIGHAPGSPMTVRYTLGAVPSVLKRHMARVQKTTKRAGLSRIK